MTVVFIYLFVLLFEVVSWILTVILVIAIVMRIVNPQVFDKYLYRIVARISYRPSDSVKAKGSQTNTNKNRRDKKSLDEEQLIGMLERILKNIDMLQVSIEQLESNQKSTATVQDPFPSKELDIDFQDSQPQPLSDNIEPCSLNQPQDDFMRDSDWRQSINSYQFYYAFAPTSSRPYGFHLKDFSDVKSGQPFIIQRQNDNKAILTLNEDPAVCQKILPNIAYYNRIVDYEYEPHEGQVATKFEILEDGLLIKQHEIWTIQKKIRIKVY